MYYAEALFFRPPSAVAADIRAAISELAADDDDVDALPEAGGSR